MSVERLPGTPSTPLLMLHKMLEDVEKIESIVAVVAWKSPEGNGVTHQVVWTSQNHSTMAVAAIACQSVVAREIMKP